MMTKSLDCQRAQATIEYALIISFVVVVLTGIGFIAIHHADEIQVRFTELFPDRHPDPSTGKHEDQVQGDNSNKSPEDLDWLTLWVTIVENPTVTFMLQLTAISLILGFIALLFRRLLFGERG